MNLDVAISPVFLAWLAYNEGRAVFLILLCSVLVARFPRDLHAHYQCDTVMTRFTPIATVFATLAVLFVFIIHHSSKCNK